MLTFPLMSPDSCIYIVLPYMSLNFEMQTIQALPKMGFNIEILIAFTFLQKLISVNCEASTGSKQNDLLIMEFVFCSHSSFSHSHA